MKNGFKLLLVTLPLAAIGGVILGFVVSTKAPPARIEIVERAVPVRVITAETLTISPTIDGFGLVAPAHSFEAIAEVGGRVDYVHPDLLDGQFLPAGSVLVRLSSTDFNLAIAQANANIRAAEARLGELDVSKENQRAALEIEREILTVKAADLARAEALFSASTLSQSGRDKARALYLAQRQKVQGIEGTLALVPTQRAVQIEQIAVYQTNLDAANLNLERTVLTLPIPARVSERNVEVGQFLKAGQTAAILDGIDQAEVEVQVVLKDLRNLMKTNASQNADLPLDPAYMATALRDQGLAAEVRLRLGDDHVRWDGKVDRISDGIDPRTGTVGVVVSVDAAYAQAGFGDRPPLTKGMFVDVVLSAPPVTGIIVPRNALHDGKLYVVDADSRLRFLSATPEIVQGSIALINGDIPEGTQIVLSVPNPAIEGLLLNPQQDVSLMPRFLAEDATR